MNYRTRWQRPFISSLPTSLADWLVHPGSLTRQLQASFDDFSVQLLQHSWQRPLPDEAQLLRQPLNQYTLQREVFLQHADVPLVYARTVIPRTTYNANPQRFDGLGTKPLGEMLFTDPTVRRGPIRVACLFAGQPLYQHALARMTQLPDILWARRSCFYLAQRPVLVNEVFLPSDSWSQL